MIEIREYIACPQFGDKNYGKWGALRLEQREAFLQLIETVEFLEDKIETQQEEIGRLEGKISHLKNINMRNDAHLHVQLIEHSKAEAYREITEKIKAIFPKREDEGCTLDDCYALDCIDKILKEFLEGLKNG